MKEAAIVCHICKKNISNYIKILDGYICEDCEREITTLERDDIKYEYYNIILKRMWHQYLISM